MTYIEKGTSLYDYDRLMLLGELMEEDNIIVESSVKKMKQKSMPEWVKICVCRELGIENERLLLKSREGDIRETRQIIMYFCRQLTNLSFKAIGAEFNLNHATVIHACNSVSDQILFCPEFKRKIERLKECITKQE